jgi:hypothetical protein
MSSDDFGDSDDEALLIAATQAGTTQTQEDGFDGSPRPAKRRRVEREIGDTDDEDNLSEPSSQSLGGFDVTQADTNFPDEEEQENYPPQRPKHHFYTPKVNANLNRIIVTQTQLAAPSQPWMIRGPIWRKPKPVGSPNPVGKPQNVFAKPNVVVRGSEDAMRRKSLSDDDDEDIERLFEEESVSILEGDGTGTMQM